MSGALMEEWKNYCNGNVDIFEFINRAIKVAASEHPTEFLIQRQKIADTLFSSELFKSSESNKKPSNMASCTEADDETTKVLRIKKLVSPETKVTEDHEAKEVEEVLRMKKILDKISGDESEVCDSLRKFQEMGLSMKTLEATGIGKSVSLLKKHASKNVCQIAVTLVKERRAMVEEWINNKQSQPIPTTDHVKKLGGMDLSEKLEATKRKLREAYEKAENMKRQRRVQVMELHQVTNQGLLLPQKKTCLNHNYKRKGFGRR